MFLEGVVMNAFSANLGSDDDKKIPETTAKPAKFPSPSDSAQTNFNPNAPRKDREILDEIKRQAE